MFCGSCGTKQNQEELFCSNCGAKNKSEILENNNSENKSEILENNYSEPQSLNENKDIIIHDIDSVLDTIPYHEIKYLLGRSYQELNKIDDALFYYSSAINDIEKGFKGYSFFRKTINDKEEKYCR